MCRKISLGESLCETYNKDYLDLKLTDAKSRKIWFAVSALSTIAREFLDATC
jgi:hypothetical protein